MKRSRSFALLASLAAVVAPLAAPQGQAPVPTFKSEVTYVEVDVVVTDQDGRFVRDLTAADFQLLQDGKPQAIAAFSVVDIPLERAEPLPHRAAAPPPDVRDNLRPFEGRIYVMVIDDTHTGFQRTGLVRRAARQFIEQRLGENDLMAIVHTAGSTESNQEFTSDKRLLLAAVDRTAGRRLRSATASRIEHRNNTLFGRQSEDTRVADPEEAERAFAARHTLQTLRSVADWFAAVRGRRKSILFMSEGISYDVHDVFNNVSASTIKDEMREVIAAASRSNVNVYGIDPRGLTSMADEDIEIGSYPEDPSLGLSRSSLMDELRLSQQSLQVLAEDTGGFAVINQNDFQGAFDRIVRENSSYYVLAFDPPDQRRDGKFHKIEVKVNRPGVKVQARKGYASPRGKPAAPSKADAAMAPEIQAALGSPLPATGLALSVFATPFRGASGKASVLLGTELRGRDLSFDAAGKLEISSVAIDAKGQVKTGETETVTMALKPETRARMERTGLRVLSRIELPPGRHQVRVAARDSGNGRVGSVTVDLEVPDFDKEKLSISGLAVTSAMALGMPTARPDASLQGVLPGSPVGARQFLRNDQAVVYAEVYDTERAAHTVDVTTTATSLADGAVVFRTTEEYSPAPDVAKGITVALPLPDLADGTYVLKVEARSRRGGATAAREIPFTVIGRATQR